MITDTGGLDSATGFETWEIQEITQYREESQAVKHTNG
jgi:hypothetical protein